MIIINDKVIIINLDDWVVVYFKGKKFDEGHSLPNDTWIGLGILMKESNIDISDIINVDIWLDDSMVLDESLLCNWSNYIDDLDDEIISIIKHEETRE